MNYIDTVQINCKAFHWKYFYIDYSYRELSWVTFYNIDHCQESDMLIGSEGKVETSYI